MQRWLIINFLIPVSDVGTLQLKKKGNRKVKKTVPLTFTMYSVYVIKVMLHFLVMF